MKITRNRYNELGLGLDKEACLSCMFCTTRNNKECCEDMPDMTIDEAIKLGMECPGIDEERLRSEMTDEEYDAWRHGRLEVEDSKPKE